MPRNLKDAALKTSLALPNGAAATVSAAGIDLGHTSTRGQPDGLCEARIEAPLLAVGAMANAKTMTYDLITSASANMAAPTTLQAAVLTQTGAGGVGCAAAEATIAIPSNALRYLGIRATGSAAGDASASSATFRLVF